MSQTIDLLRVTGSDYVGSLPPELHSTLDFVYLAGFLAGATQHRRNGSHWRRSVNLRIGHAEVEASFAVTFASNTSYVVEADAEIGSDPPVQVGQWADDERRLT